MLQIIQSFKTGETILEEVPSPEIKKGHILVKTNRSLVSLGTERMLVEFGKSGYLAKAKQQPDKVKQVLDKIKTDGLLTTYESVTNKLAEPLPLGYCNAGEVIAVGDGVKGFKIGDRVASNGAHAEYVCVPENLAANIPDNVSYEEAAFTVISSIGLQGIRLLNPMFGETIVVVGLGLIGLITSSLLRSNGCNVIGIEPDPKKAEIAKQRGITVFPVNSQVENVLSATNGTGADGIIITASNKSNDIISCAAKMSRKRGRIVLVGVIGLDISRADFYEKELTFQVSCSYGPGRYDPDYEQKGIDYPLPYVRWTEKRNFEAVLVAISQGALEVKSLITEKVKLSDYKRIYDNLSSADSIASLIEYSVDSQYNATVKLTDNKLKSGKGLIGIIGAGNFTKMTMLPSLKDYASSIKYIVSANGVTGTYLAKKYGISYSTTDFKQVLQDEETDSVIITTRHNLHAPMVVESLKAGKNILVEKPLVLNEDELNEVIDTYKKTGGSLTVGFNRRFSPFSKKAKEIIGNSGQPITVIANMNAGFIPQNIWVHDMKTGGGRIIGEACHFFDLITYFTGSLISEVKAEALGCDPSDNTDNLSMLLKYKNGSLGIVNYFSTGSKAYSKERIEIHFAGKSLVIDNFKALQAYGVKGFSKMKGRQDKGHKEQFTSFAKRIKEGGNALIPFDQLVNTTKATFAAVESFKCGASVRI